MAKQYTTDTIRNICLIGHGGTGKTTLTENLLYFSGAIDKLGTVESGSTISDFDEEEKKRKISISNSLCFTDFQSNKINIIDTPGTPDFVGEVRPALRVTEGAIVVVDSVDGIQIGTQKIWEYADEYGVPRIIFINKMDKERANFEEVVLKMQDQFDKPVVPIEIPIGQAENFEGVIDLLSMKALYPKADKKGIETKEIPAEYLEQAQKYKEKLVEAVAEIDDKLIEKFLEGEQLTDEEIAEGVKDCTQQFKIIPIVCGSATQGIGIVTLLKMIIKFLPSPLFVGETLGFNPSNEEELISRRPSVEDPCTAFIYKTRIDQYAGKFSYFRVRAGEITPELEVINASSGSKVRLGHLYSLMGSKPMELDKVTAGDIGVVSKVDELVTGDTVHDSKNPIKLPPLKLPMSVYSLAITSENKGDEDKIVAALHKIALEDPTFKIAFNAETSETIISGMGEIQLDVILKSIQEKNNFKIITEVPRVAYRETIRKQSKSQYRHKKQTGGHGQFGEVYIDIAPIERGKGFEFEDKIVGGAIPRGYIPGVEKGLKEAMQQGTLAKYPLTDIKVVLYDGSFHPVDSSEMSFKIAAWNAMKNAVKDAEPILLEPVMKVTIFADKELTGDVMGDIQGRRGRILGMEEGAKSSNQVINAQVPLSEMLRYSTDLRSLTRDRATFEMTFSHYDPITGKLADKVILERQEAE